MYVRYSNEFETTTTTTTNNYYNNYNLRTRVTPVLGECRKQLIALKTYIIIIIIIIIVIKLNRNRGKEKKIV